MQLNFKCARCGTQTDYTSISSQSSGATFHLVPCDKCVGELMADNAELNKNLHKANKHNTVLFVMMIVALFVMVVVAAPVGVQILLSAMGVCH